jgi:hypothetical protein
MSGQGMFLMASHGPCIVTQCTNQPSVYQCSWSTCAAGAVVLQAPRYPLPASLREPLARHDSEKIHWVFNARVRPRDSRAVQPYIHTTSLKGRPGPCMRQYYSVS